MQYTSVYQSPLGKILLACDETSLNGLWFEGEKYFALHLAREYIPRETPVTSAVRDWLDIYFSGREPGFMPLMRLRGTPFQLSVWNILLQIPYGRTTTYGEIAKRLAKDRGLSRMSAQAVGRAVGHNEISVIVPCHRVVGSNGSLTGYAGGLEKKIRLLQLEGVSTEEFFMPRKGTAV